MTRPAIAFIALLFLVDCNLDLGLDVGVDRPESRGPVAARAESLHLAEAFLRELDERGESYDLLSVALRNETSRAHWQGIVDQTRGSVGQFSIRALRAYLYTESLEDAPPGRYFVIEFDSVFSGKNVVEKVVVALGGDVGGIAGYFVTTGLPVMADEPIDAA